MVLEAENDERRESGSQDTQLQFKFLNNQDMYIEYK